MQIGLIGAGNMARALARGWGRPVLCADLVPDRAAALAAETGGEALADAGDVARRADLVVLCHKPAQLQDVAATAGDARAVASILGGVSRAAVVAAYPDRPVYRLLPSTPVEVRQGVVLLARAEPQPLDEAVVELFAGLGLLVPLEEELVDAAMGLMSTAPAYYALVAEAQVDAGVRHGIPADRAAQLVVQTMAGSAALLSRRGHDTLAVRREVTSPGGSTARGLDALERGGVRAAFSDALDAVRQQGGVEPVSTLATFVLAAFRDDLAGYVRAVVLVYTLLIIAYILSSLFFSFGGRVPYARWSSALLGFLRDVVEPYLSIFRRFIPPIGPLDLSPIVAIFLLQIVGGIVASLIEG